MRAFGVLALVMLSYAMLAMAGVVGVIPAGRGWLLGMALGVMFCAGSVAAPLLHPIFTGPRDGS